MASTPLRRIIAVGSELALPSVLTSITASPVCSSARVASGMRFNICCMSPPLPPARPPPASAPAGMPDAAPGAAAPEAPGGVPFKRAAIRWATMGGSILSCESPVIFTVTGFLLNRSLTVRVPLEASTSLSRPAMFRKEPETISSALRSPPSALRVPRARSWSPGLIWSRVPGVASSNLTESGD
jgi:hypothetical protein